MQESERRSSTPYVTADFIPGTDVLAVGRKETDPPFGPAPSNPDPSVVHDEKPESSVAADPRPFRYERFPGQTTRALA
jgi:hypothetical protein